jgi:hypothetical protein
VRSRSVIACSVALPIELSADLSELPTLIDTAILDLRRQSSQLGESARQTFLRGSPFKPCGIERFGDEEVCGLLEPGAVCQ